MFSNSNQNPLFGGSAAQGGLFGGPKPQTGTPATGAGLLGNTTGQPTAGPGGLFPQPQPQGGTPIGTNMFGGAPAQPQTGTTLFGAASNKPPMFGGAPQQTQPGTATNQPVNNNPLLGAPQGGASQGQGQMFGAGAPAGGGMFGQPKPQQTATSQPMTSAPMFGGAQGIGLQQPGQQVDPNKQAAGQADPNKGGGLVFGADIHKKGSPSKEASMPSQHMIIGDLFNKWKKDLEDQVNDFLKLGRNLNKDEKELYDMHNMLTNLNSNIKQLEIDYGHIQGSLGGLERQQDELINRLNQIEGELSQALPSENEESHLKSSANLLNKAKELNKETILIEKSIQKLVDEVNQPLKEYNEDVTKILNSYYEALEYIELDTMMIQNKLSNFEMIVQKNGL